MPIKKTATGPKDKLKKSSMTTLKAKAKKLKIKGFSTKKKDQLVNSIMMAEARAKRKPGKKRKVTINPSKRRAAPNLPMRKPVMMRGHKRRRMMSDYQGWTNYATWRVNLEVFDGYEPDEAVDADYIKDMLEEAIETNPDLAISYALAFVNDVNYYEIADSINETYELE